MYNLILGDCLEKMQNIPDKSIDMILCDLPYGTTQCKWDSIIPFDRDSLDQYAKIIGTYNKELEAKKSKPIEKLSYEFDGEPIADKINELVDAVNLLLDKSTES